MPTVTEGVKVVDSSGMELDDDVFEDIVKDSSHGVITIKYNTGLYHLPSIMLFYGYGPYP